MMGFEKSRILIVAAHPDDEILGCAGTVARLQEKGHEVFSLVLGEGITSRYDVRSQAPSEELKKLHASSDTVAAAMGFQDHWLLDFPDNRFDSVPLLDVIKVVEKIQAKVKPRIIFTHFEGDLNVDHRVTFQAVLTASRPVGDHCRELYSFEIPSSTEWASPYARSFRPNTFVDVTGYLEKKVEAMLLYESEVAPFPHPRSAEALRAIAHRWGTVCGCSAAEAFMQIRRII